MSEPTVDPRLVKDVEVKYSEIFAKGMICDVSCHGGGFKIQNKPEDFGKTRKDIPDGVYLGNKLWLPKAVANGLTLIHAKARRAVEKRSLSFPIANLRFVKMDLISDVRDDVADRQKELVVWQKDLLANYEEYKKQVLAAMPQYAPSLRAAFKPVELILMETSISLSFFEISLPRQITSLDYSTVKQREQAVDYARERAGEALRGQIQAHTQAFDDFFSSAKSELQGIFMEEFKSTLARLQDNKPVTERTTTMLRRVIREFNTMDILDSQDIKSRLQQVEAALLSGSVGSAAGNVSLRGALHDVVTYVNNLSNEERSARSGRLLRKFK